MYRQGDEFGDNAALINSIAIWKEISGREYPRERVPLDWAMTQKNLGTALATLGERESGTARLEEAVAAYRAALEERTRERVPLDWAMTQMNLGTALGRWASGRAGRRVWRRRWRRIARRWRRGRAIGCRSTGRRRRSTSATRSGRWATRESGTARLEEAVAAYRAALEERTRERVPLEWAMTQMNLGAALATLGERESGTARLEEAVAAYRAALEERTRDRVPLDWAMTQMNLGIALETLGERESGTARLEEAVGGVSRGAGGEDARSGAARLGDDADEPRHRARDAGQRESGTARLEEAVAAWTRASQSPILSGRPTGFELSKPAATSLARSDGGGKRPAATVRGPCSGGRRTSAVVR